MTFDLERAGEQEIADATARRTRPTAYCTGTAAS
jgi:hypothetical protein